METLKKISITPYLIVGIGLGALLSLSYAYLINYSLIYYGISFYGILFLMTIPYTRNLRLPAFSTLIPALLSCLPFVFHQTQQTFSTIMLAIFSAYMISSFHIHILKHGWKVHYSTLFYAVWDSFVRLFAATFFSMLCWLILLLISALFGFINIRFLQTLMDKSAFDIFCLSIFASMGFYLAMKTQPILHQVRSIFLFICRSLLIPLSVISIVFMGAAAVMLVTQQHDLKFHESVLMAIAFLSMLFINALYQDGRGDQIYPRLLTSIYRIFLLITPIFTMLALYTLVYQADNNIAAYGVNLNNFSYLRNIVLLLCYNLFYAALSLNPHKQWLRGIEKINVVLAVAVIMVTLLTTNPLFSRVFPQTTMQLEMNVPVLP